MPRPPRVHVQGAIYLVTARGEAATPLFQDPQDYDAYLKLLAEHKTRYAFGLFAYCLLPDAVYLCLEPAAGTTLSAIMHDLTTAYTRYVNKRYQRSGSLFRERFKETVVEKGSSLLSATVYLHSLPLQAGLVQEPKGYPFSSCRRYCSAEVSTDRLEMDAEIGEVLSLLPAPAVYEQYVDALPKEELERLDQLFQQRIVGSEAFVDLVKARRTPRPVVVDGTSPHSGVAPLHRPHMALVSASLAAVVFSGLIVASLHQRIGSLQQTLMALSEENEASFRTRASLAIQREAIGELAGLEGTEWDVRLMPLDAQNTQAIQQDQLTFTRRQVASGTLAAQGFSTSNYTVVMQPDGTVNWETMQTNPSGELVSWQGEWHGPVMRGVLTRQTASKTSEHFTFVAVARKPATLRSET